MSEVPCNGCTLCCRADAVRILPHEDASRWQTEPHASMPYARMLAHKPNGDCVYLGPTGCTTHADKPQVCHEMDCRHVAPGMSFDQARASHLRKAVPLRVWRRGQELLLKGKR